MMIREADTLIEKGDFDGAVRTATNAISLDPQNPIIYLKRGSAYLGGAHYDKALSDFMAAVTLDPGNASAYFGRAAAYEKLGLKTHAAADRQRALKLMQKFR